MILDRVANESFGVDGAGQVNVQVRALGHLEKECPERQRILAGRVNLQVAFVCAAIFSRASRGMSRGSLGERKERQKEKSDNQPGFAGAGGVAAIAIWLCEHGRPYFSTRAIHERAAQRVLIGRIGLERCVAMRRGVELGERVSPPNA